jgi:glutaminase
MAQGSPVFSASLDPSQLAGWIAAAKALVPQGRIPDYIPGLGKANPNWLALKVHLSEDWVYQTGEVEQPFVLMSVIKPFVLLYLLERFGAEQVFSWWGSSPLSIPFTRFNNLKLTRAFPATL